MRLQTSTALIPRGRRKNRSQLRKHISTERNARLNSITRTATNGTQPPENQSRTDGGNNPRGHLDYIKHAGQPIKLATSAQHPLFDRSTAFPTALRLSAGKPTPSCAGALIADKPSAPLLVRAARQGELSACAEVRRPRCTDEARRVQMASEHVSAALAWRRADEPYRPYVATAHITRFLPGRVQSGKCNAGSRVKQAGLDVVACRLGGPSLHERQFPLRRGESRRVARFTVGWLSTAASGTRGPSGIQP